MNKHFKELLFIILSVSPLLILSILSNMVEVPADISYEGIDRKMLMFSNSLFLLFFLLPFFVVRKNKDYLMNFNHFRILPFVFIIITTFLFIILNAPVIEWNRAISFPEFMSGFEEWATLKEKQLESLTIHLISFDNTTEYLIGILTIAIIPGFCEEYFFRGVLQKNFKLLLNNPHVAIVLSALLFSAFHLQFYGFFPRFLLGVLFGYMFYWSGSLIYPVIAHALNNFIGISLVYAAKSGFFGEGFDMPINSSPDIPISILAFSFFLFILAVVKTRSILSKKHE